MMEPDWICPYCGEVNYKIWVKSDKCKHCEWLRVVRGANSR